MEATLTAAIQEARASLREWEGYPRTGRSHGARAAMALRALLAALPAEPAGDQTRAGMQDSAARQGPRLRPRREGRRVMLTVDQCMSLDPCPAYSRARVESLWAGREALTAGEVAALPIPHADRLWCLLRMAGREVWLPAIYAAAERAIRAACWALHGAGLADESARLEHQPPIVDAETASAAASAAWAAWTASAAASAACAAWTASAAASAASDAWTASAAASAADLEATVAHVARLIDAAKGGAE